MCSKPSFSGAFCLSTLVERSHSPTISFAGLVLLCIVLSPLREVLHSCNILEVLLCHWFVFSFLECRWPDFHVLFLKYSGTNTFLSLLDTQLLIRFQIILPLRCLHYVSRSQSICYIEEYCQQGSFPPWTFEVDK